MSAPPRISQEPCRALWAQVVLQAKEDLQGQSTSSIHYDQAVAFFVGTGHWAEARAVIADLLEMHPDYLCSSGTRWIAERRVREGLPPEPPPSPPRASVPLPRLVALSGPTRRAPKAYPMGSGFRHDALALPSSGPPLDPTTRSAGKLPAKRPRNWHRWAQTGMANPFAPRR